MHDPFAMRPFFGYNFGHYMKHWLCLKKRPNATMPKIFHVNWFRKNDNGKFIWPGFGENARVLDWICRRVDGEDIAEKSIIGYLPKPNSLVMDGLEGRVDMDALFDLPKEFWEQEVKDIRKYLEEQVNEDVPDEIWEELEKLNTRVEAEKL